MIYEPLTWQHLRLATHLGWGGWSDWSDARLRWLPLVGYVGLDEKGAMLGFGGVAWAQGPHKPPLAFFKFHPDVRDDPRSRWVHRPALEVLEVAHVRAPVIHAKADPAIPRAEVWLKRLGFTTEDGEIWAHGRTDQRFSGGGRFVHHVELGDDCGGYDRHDCARGDGP